jgi:hypothetical protein
MNSLKVKITSKLETSHHDGYCSGDECEYDVDTKSYIVDLPEELNGSYDDIFSELDFEWEDLLPIPNLNNRGNNSFYCRNSCESSKNHLGKHDYRYTILSVELIN